jgi:hypothetical protein
VLTSLSILALLSLPAAGIDEVTFEREVEAVLSKAGCNSGACHGNLNGKGGFKLSLRGEDPAYDYEQLARQFSGRRVNRFDPESSLLLQKPAGQTPHQGGVRFKRDSLEYELLHAWMARGAAGPEPALPKLVGLEVTPGDAVLPSEKSSVQIQAVARFADGTTREVSRLAAYDLSTTDVQVSPEGLVTRLAPGVATVVVRYLTEQRAVRVAFLPEREDVAWRPLPQHSPIDALVDERLRVLQIQPAPASDDGTFLRRASLDLVALLPTADEARDFVAATDPDKRERALDRLLSRPEFAEFWALKFSDILRNEEKVLDATGVDRFYSWLRDSLAVGQRLDALARDLLSAEGSTYDNPPANYYRANRDAFTRGETTARLFLGVRLQCARCHNHPFDRWTMDDYYDWAAVFARVDYKVLENERRDKLDKNEFTGEQIVVQNGEQEVTNARTGKPARPRLLGANLAPIARSENRLQTLAEWVASPRNALFSKAQANFAWYHLVGRGLVEPIDDVRQTNPPSHPAVLDWLAAELVRGEFDLRRLLRTIASSRVYQAASEPNGTSVDDPASFARGLVRRLTAEQLLDAQAQVLDLPLKFTGYPEGTRAAQVKGVQRISRRQPGTDGDRMLRTFGKPDRLLACECERSNETTLKQALVLIGDDDLNRRLAGSEGRLARLAQSELSTAEVVAELYWTALTRAPTSAELSAAVALFETTTDRQLALEDLAWALFNAKEFIFRH